MDRPAMLLLKHFDEMMDREPKLADVIKLKNKNIGSLQNLYNNYVNNIIHVMENEGYTFGEALDELRRSPHGDYYGVGEGEDAELLDYIEKIVRV